MINFDFSISNLKEIWNEHKNVIIGFYSFIGLPGLLISVFRDFYFENFLITIIFSVISTILPFIYYQKDLNSIRMLKKKVVHIRDGRALDRFGKISYSDTTTTIFFQIGSNIKSHYILISKIKDIECSFSLPNETDYKLIDRDNRDFYIIKCRSNSLKKFTLTINTNNGNKFVGENDMLFLFKKGGVFDNKIKNKKIDKLVMFCSP